MTLEQLAVLEQLAKENNFGRGPGHAKQVRKLSLKIYDELVRLGLLDGADRDKAILSAVALLHDIGLPKEPHNEAAFNMLNSEIPKLLATQPLPLEDLSALLYCVLWHRGSRFAGRGNIEIVNPGYTRKMAAITRVADALDRTLRQLVEDVSLGLSAERLSFTVTSEQPIEVELSRAKDKSDLLKEAFRLAAVDFRYGNG